MSLRPPQGGVSSSPLQRVGGAPRLSREPGGPWQGYLTTRKTCNLVLMGVDLGGRRWRVICGMKQMDCVEGGGAWRQVPMSRNIQSQACQHPIPPTVIQENNPGSGHQET